MDIFFYYYTLFFIAIFLVLAIGQYKKIPGVLEVIIVCVIYPIFLIMDRSDFPDIPYYIIQINDSSNYVSSQFFGAFDTKGELGFNLLISVLYNIIGDANYVLFIISLIMFLCFIFGSLLIYREYLVQERLCNLTGHIYSRFNYLLFLGIFISGYGTMYGLVVIRGGLSLAFLYLGLAYLITRKYVHSLLILLIALTFHQVAYIGLLGLVVILQPMQFTKTLHKILFWTALGAQLFGLHLLIPSLNINEYLGLSTNKDESLLGSYVAKSGDVGLFSYKVIFLFYVYIILIKYLDLNNRITERLFRSFAVGFFLLVVGQKLLAMTRVADYFLVVTPILFYIMSTKSIGNTRRIISTTIIIVANYIFTLRAIVL